jgi:hypothetical protein
VVTNLPAEGFPGEPAERFAASALYEKLYCARGEMENRIKEAQQDLFVDRTSTSWMASNQFRLWFSAFAHLMVSVLRAEVLRGTDLAAATLGQIRLKLFKIGCPHQDQLSAHSSGVSQRPVERNLYFTRNLQHRWAVIVNRPCQASLRVSRKDFSHESGLSVHRRCAGRILCAHNQRL